MVLDLLFILSTDSMGTPTINGRCRKNGACFFEARFIWKNKTCSKATATYCRKTTVQDVSVLLGHAGTLSQQRMRCGYFLHSYSLCCAEEGWRWLFSKGGVTLTSKGCPRVGSSSCISQVWFISCSSKRGVQGHLHRNSCWIA